MLDLKNFTGLEISTVYIYRFRKGETFKMVEE